MRRLLAIVLVGIATVGCSPEETVPSPPIPDLGDESGAAAPVGDIAGESTTATLATTGTSLPDWQAIYGEFVEDWNWAQATGSLAHLRRVVHPESLHLYGEDACAAHIQTLDPIPTPFQLRRNEDQERGFKALDLDGMLTSVFLADVQQITHTNGRFEATWASPFAYGSQDDWRWPLHAAVLLDCGDPIEGRYPLMLAEMAGPNDDTGLGAQSVDLEAPEQWWIDVWVRNGECDVSIADSASTETLISHTVRYHTAAELSFGGPLSITASGDCRWVRAVSDPELVSTDITDLRPNPASVWLVTIVEDDDGLGTWFPFVNSGELPMDISGWEVHVEEMVEPFVFPDGSELGPVMEIRFHAGCGTDEDQAKYLCLPGGLFENGTITLYDAEGEVVDGL